MNRNIVDLSDYQAVLALARAGSFRVASDALGLSPSAMSRQIAALEERLGARLFDRDTRNVKPTDSGKALARVAERVLNTAQDGMAEFDAHLSARNGHLTIAGLPSVTAGLLPGLLKSFTTRYPDIDLQIMDTLSGNVLEAVESGTADIGFTAGTVSARSRLSFQALLDDAFVAIGAPDGPLAEERPFKWAEVAEMPFIAMAKGTSVRELLDGACMRIGIQLNPRFDVSHLATAGALVAEGLGVTALPSLTLPVLRTESLILREIEDFGVRRRIGLVRRSGHSLSPSAEAFLAHVREHKLQKSQWRTIA
ncbi:LysR family transcriptional regulator [Roseibium salinum]|uniref:LysR family transcriptional regulator n=1 Tax=Roseibium salinum TaxID=1604349 RepID=A0ABT3QWD7_9HYPH|nr:LysR family transcriptional regulator [Roseibium sp. DSM 29163]MCW1404444.1 LysR family transcriptional regulator [Novosphingobium sp. MW5]MCX2721243.1 LysR family transcriptional regulator [Roseibium sp. DSM 29163]MDN3722705.1 LysR family transcriptional regulator [Roseibium salinum]